MLNNIASKTPAELTYIKRSSYMNDVNTENNWTSSVWGTVLMYQSM